MIPRVIPTLLLDGNGLVKTICFKNKTYIGDPINTVRLFNDLEVDELTFLDINATKNKSKIRFELLKEIASECFMPLAYGGGITRIEDIQHLFKIGFEKVIINSALINNSELILTASKLFGSQSIVASIDVKKNFWGKKQVFINSATKNTNIDPVVHALNLVKMGCGEILLTSVDNEGKMKGYDIELIKSVSTKLSIPVIASGGAGDFSDFKKAIFEGKASAVAAGSLFVYHGKTKGILITFPTQTQLNNIFNND